MIVLAFMPVGAGTGEYLLLLVVVLIVYGPRRLPEIARQIVQWRNRLQRSGDLFRAQILQLEREAERALEAEQSSLAPEPPPSNGQTLPPDKSGGGDQTDRTDRTDRADQRELPTGALVQARQTGDARPVAPKTPCDDAPEAP